MWVCMVCIFSLNQGNDKRIRQMNGIWTFDDHSLINVVALGKHDGCNYEGEAAYEALRSRVAHASEIKADD
jgi:hypothetical protein